MVPGSDANSAFLNRAQDLLRALLLELDAFDPDELEAESSEGVVRLTFADGSKCILNRQSIRCGSRKARLRGTSSSIRRRKFGSTPKAEASCAACLPKS